MRTCGGEPVWVGWQLVHWTENDFSSSGQGAAQSADAISLIWLLRFGATPACYTGCLDGKTWPPWTQRTLVCLRDLSRMPKVCQSPGLESSLYIGLNTISTLIEEPFYYSSFLRPLFWSALMLESNNKPGNWLSPLPPPPEFPSGVNALSMCALPEQEKS